MDEVEKAHSDTPNITPDFPQSELQDKKTSPHEEKPSQSPPTLKHIKNLRKKLLITFAAMFFLALSTSTVFLFQKRKGSSTSSPTSFDECKKSPGSNILESYPEVCVTKDNKRFTRPISEPVQQSLDTSTTWKTYKSSEFGISFQYPKDATITNGKVITIDDPITLEYEPKKVSPCV